MHKCTNFMDKSNKNATVAIFTTKKVRVVTKEWFEKLFDSSKKINIKNK